MVFQFQFANKLPSLLIDSFQTSRNLLKLFYRVVVTRDENVNTRTWLG